MMGITKGTVPPEPPADGTYWLGEEGASDRVLRPQWLAGWPANREAWFKEFLTKIRKDGKRWCGKISTEELADTADDTIEEVCSVAFQTMVRDSQKDAAERAEKKVIRRREGRQKTVSERRSCY